ncbi:MAG: hypothetical protein II594_00185, partial [Clostridium sp.]|nr:hypothetical protein [Clostridium sp.]
MKTWKTLQKKAAALLIAVLAVLTPLSSYAAVWQQGTGDYANRAQYIGDLGQPAVNTWLWLDRNSDGIAERYWFGPDGYTLPGGAAPDGQLV